MSVAMRSNDCGIACTSSGRLIVTCRATNSIFVIDPTTGEDELLAGGGTLTYGSIGSADGPGRTVARFNNPVDVVVVDHEQCAYVADQENSSIRCVTLPPSLFVHA